MHYSKIIKRFLSLNSIVFLLSSIFTFISAQSVIELTKENADQVFQQHEIVLLNFYAKWCHFSKLLAPVFEEAHEEVRKRFHSSQVALAKVDSDIEVELAKKFKISKYPTLKVVIDGKLHKLEYRGQRTKDALVEHVVKMMQDPIVNVEQEDSFVDIDIEKNALLDFSSVQPNTTREYTTFLQVARMLHDSCNFYWITGPVATAHSQEGRLNYISHKPLHEKHNSTNEIYDQDLNNFEQLYTWAHEKCVPLVREITFENAEELTEERLPLVILFYLPEQKDSIKLFKEAVEREGKNEPTVNFVIANGNTFVHPLMHLNKSKKDLPLVALDSFQHMYTFPNFDDLSIPNKLSQFIKDLHSGKLHREFHFGPDIQTIEFKSEAGDAKPTPPKSTFKNLQPSSNRYTLLRDEL